MFTNGFSLSIGRRLPALAAGVLMVAGLGVPAVVRADALPDGRVYEQVSPTNKHGNDAGAPGGSPKYAWATADGNGLFYGVRGAMGTVHRGIENYAIGRRDADGWSSESAIPGGAQERIFAIAYQDFSLVPSSDLNSVLFTSGASLVSDNPVTAHSSAGLFEGHADGTVDWLTRPQIPNPVPAPGSIPNIHEFQPVGGSPDLSTVYFWSNPTLLAQDATRQAAGLGGWGLYEYSGGVLKPAGTLPNGTESPGGAAPAASISGVGAIGNYTTPETTRNQVSRDGSTLWFVSPDPQATPQAGEPVELYVRRGGHSALVSHTANGAPAPSGAAPVLALNSAGGDPSPHVFAYGSPDGKSVIFQSLDQLTSEAPSDSSQKAYRYEVDTGTVTYLPGVGGSTVVASSDDAQRFLFGDSLHVALWDEGTVTTIASFASLSVGAALAPARATASGSVFLFSTQASIPGFNSGGASQVYRYDVAQEKLLCVSCPPDGVVPSGNARLSNQDSTGLSVAEGDLVASRGMSDDGQRVFFDTPDALLPRDANGRRDVYEWTPSGLSLISSGRSGEDSLFLDNSANGKDVFFATSEGLVAGDTDGAYDVYDARMDGGFTPADAAAPCTGDGCQGALSGSLSLLAPASVGFLSGAGEAKPPGAVTRSKAAVRIASHRVTGDVLELTVNIAGPGRVSLTGNGLHSLTRSYGRAGSFKLRVALMPKAKQRLKAGHRLTLAVRVGFTPVSGAASSVKLVLSAKL